MANLLQKKRGTGTTVIIPAMSIKKAFYKWYVLAGQDFVSHTVEKMLKNCKINESKAAYIIFQKILQERDQDDGEDINEKNKRIYSATFSLVQFFERKNRQAY